MDSDERRGRTFSDLIAENKKIVLAILSFLGVIIIAGSIFFAYEIYSAGGTIKYKDFQAKFGGQLDTLNSTQQNMIIVRDISKQVVQNSRDPKIQDDFRKIGTQASVIIEQTTGLRDRLLAFNKQSDPLIQEEILKDVLANYGVSQNILNNINLGIVDKYVESDSLKNELRILKSDSSKKKRLMDNLQAENKILRERLRTMRSDTVVIKDTAYQKTMDSLQKVLDINDSISKDNNRMRNELDSTKPFFIEQARAGLMNVGTRKSGEYKEAQIKKNDVYLYVLPILNPSYNKPFKSEYKIIVEFSYISAKNSVIQSERDTITIQPNIPFNNKITLRKSIGKGRIFVTFHFEKDIIYKTDFVIGKSK